MVKRDILLTMFNWRNWPWISDLRSQFRTFSPPLRRAFIITSYSLREEGKHWRVHNKAGFSQFEKVIQDWAASKVQEHNNDKWEVPL